MASGFDRRGANHPRPDQVRRHTALGSSDLAAVAQMDIVTDAQTGS